MDPCVCIHCFPDTNACVCDHCFPDTDLSVSGVLGCKKVVNSAGYSGKKKHIRKEHWFKDSLCCTEASWPWSVSPVCRPLLWEHMWRSSGNTLHVYMWTVGKYKLGMYLGHWMKWVKRHWITIVTSVYFIFSLFSLLPGFKLCYYAWSNAIKTEKSYGYYII